VDMRHWRGVVKEEDLMYLAEVNFGLRRLSIIAFLYTKFLGSMDCKFLAIVRIREYYIGKRIIKRDVL